MNYILLSKAWFNIQVIPPVRTTSRLQQPPFPLGDSSYVHCILSFYKHHRITDITLIVLLSYNKHRKSIIIYMYLFLKQLNNFIYRGYTSVRVCLKDRCSF